MMYFSPGFAAVAAPSIKARQSHDHLIGAIIRDAFVEEGILGRD